MTDNFIAFFYRERLLVAVVSMLIVAGGVLALTKLNVDAFPDVTPVQVEIDTEAQGLAPQEVEQLITFPIENVMNGISGVVRVQSISKFGLSVVNVFFRDDVDIYFARQQVFERLSLAKDSMNVLCVLSVSVGRNPDTREQTGLHRNDGRTIRSQTHAAVVV